jgi:hypothetical protein
MEELLKQSWIKGEPVDFSYTQKYLIKYGHHAEAIGGTFSGKPYGYSYVWVENSLKFCVQIEESKKYYAVYLEDISN